MPLSIHFYNLAEVSASLRYRITSGDVYETLFWCNELIQSGCASDAISILFDAWIWQKGPFAISWLLSAYDTLSVDEVTEESILQSCYQLRRAGSIDHSVWRILQMAAHQSIPDCILPFDHTVPSNDKTECHFIAALYQHRAYTAWCASTLLSSDRVWELLEWYGSIISSDVRDAYQRYIRALQEYDKLLGYRSEAYNIITRCTAVLTACLSVKQMTQSIKSAVNDSSMSDHISRWPFGCMGARLYSIPAAGLYGTRNISNMDELYVIEPHLIGSPYWEDALIGHAHIVDGEINWISDTLKERFYCRYFPDDIPDEWTAVEKCKSHGPGVTAAPFHVYVRKYVSRTARLCFMDAIPVSDTLSCRSLEEFVEMHLVGINPWYVIRPHVRRRLLLAC